jgi:ubiquinone/menaquinone biosynthesis C-methylase UbiE
LVLTERAAALCVFASGAHVLDVGCGPGASVGLLRDVHKVRAVGVDRSGRLLSEGRSLRGDLPLCRGDAATLPFKKEAFHGVFCECVLSLLPDPARALAEFHRALLPGGRLVVTDMYARCADEKNALLEFPTESCLRAATSREETEARVRAAGFSLLVWEDHTRHLRELTVRLILAGANASLGCDPRAARAKPGYFLLIAAKEPDSAG